MLGPLYTAMSFLPASKREWLNLLLFPFKVYVIIIPIWSMIQTQEAFFVREAQMKATDYILASYAASIFIFIFSAIIQFIAHHRRSAGESALFAVAALLALVFLLLPMFALAK
jgi:hypothetical protein